MTRRRAQPAEPVRRWLWCPTCEQHVDTRLVHEHAASVAVAGPAAPAQLSLDLPGVTP